MRQTAKNVSPMSNEGRNAYVTEHITEALFSLLREKPLDGISISVLCDRAGVGRASFYRNYESKEAVIRSAVDRMFRKWMDVHIKDNSSSLSGQLGALFGHFEEHRDFYQLLNDRGLLCFLKDVVMDFYGAKPEDQILEAYTKAYAASVLYGWIEVWFMRGMRDSAEEISELFKAHGL